jgi:hypothetical protein
MADDTAQNKTPAGDGKTTDNEVALEMMKFIALTTGYGKPTTSTTGFAGKAAKSGSEEYAEALLQLFERCRATVRKE